MACVDIPRLFYLNGVALPSCYACVYLCSVGLFSWLVFVVCVANCLDVCLGGVCVPLSLLVMVSLSSYCERLNVY
jgi:hypothetical protein